jgi:hypothetical protein
VKPERASRAEVEARVKFPEAKTRHQEITIWVTRNGRQFRSCITVHRGRRRRVLRSLEPTNEKGAPGAMSIPRGAKGTIELVVSAVAPDGGKGGPRSRTSSAIAAAAFTRLRFRRIVPDAKSRRHGRDGSNRATAGGAVTVRVP